MLLFKVKCRCGCFVTLCHTLSRNGNDGKSIFERDVDTIVNFFPIPYLDKSSIFTSDCTCPEYSFRLTP